MLNRLGRFCARHHWAVLVVWLVIAVLAVIGASARPGTPKDVFAVPGTESQAALDLLQSQFPAANGLTAEVVVAARTGTVDDPANKAAIEQTVKNLQPIVGSGGAVTDPFQGVVTGFTFDQGALTPTYQQLTINQNRTVAYIPVSFPEPFESLSQVEGLFHQLEAAAQPAVAAGLDVEYGGPVASLGNPPPEGIAKYSDYIGILVAMVILVISLGSVTSMAVPIGVALFSVTVVSTSLLKAIEYSFTIGTAAPALGTMIGLGVAIDYSLFIVSRHRQNLAEGMSTEDSVGKAIATSGSAVLFAGLTVCLALAALYFVGIPYVTTMGLVAVLFVAVSMLAALTLVPALLGLAGHKINALAAHRHDETGDTSNSLSARWARATARRPVVFAVAGVAILVVLTLPFFRMELGFTDDGNLPTSLTQRQAYDLLTTNFGPGVNGPLVVAVDLPPVDQQNSQQMLEAFTRLTNAISVTPDVARVSLPLPNRFSLDPPPTAAVVEVTPASAPNSPATADLVGDLRTNVIPAALQGSVIPANQVYVGGSTALVIDLTEAIKAKMPWYIAGVIVATFLLLMMVFHSLLVPLQAAVMNVLSIGAAYGVLVAVFQWGWGKDLIGLATVVPVMAFVPVLMFAVLFGLSMDYQVFLLSRIREAWNATGDNRESVVTGVSTTARVITSAALIMIAVFVSFVPAEDPTTKMIAIGMAAAVLIDATIVRMMLVPSSMEIVGKANWWLPHWLARILPRISVD